ncbi:sterol desaturase family protein [Jannaschia donghaensis]|uniref:Fatty acid hydroxylase superfamily protein n=1 Tax=Jannaschia donghaensis TaxID=420998 RepID=A0A0M6YGH7_9RHOB|nr:sterol desaturase family protein [Jannaschia donghaensis]CTQ49458.1 Fatty acid hydroxylase superfamily protein [Jannaschia donghaensis]
MTAILLPVFIVCVTVVATELAAAWIHRVVMHGPGWRWHKSHHEPRRGALERNDLYSLIFAGLSMGLFWAGATVASPLWWVAVGLCVYGVIYFCVHDGLVHHRWPFRHVPRRGYLRRIYQAHRLHHAVRDRDGCVAFGFVFVPPVARLRAELRANQRLQDDGSSNAPWPGRDQS